MTSKPGATHGCAVPLGVLGCSCIFNAAVYAVLAAAVVLAIRWALTTHLFGL